MAPSDGVASGVVALAEPDSTMQTPPSTAGSAASSTHGSTASGTVAPREDAAIDNAPGPRRAPSNPLLPPDLQLFLERYPQPAFVLRASTIHESIVASKSRHAAAGSGGNGLERSRQRSARPDRATTQQPAGEGEDGMQDRSECEEERLTSRQQYEGVITAEERRERAEDERDLAQLANAPSSDSSATSLPPDLAPASKPFEATPLEGRRPRAHARAARVLQEAFAADEPALAASILGAPGQGPDVLRKSTLLEGGSQKSHDPSRTAEGAVRALYAQRSEVAREKRATDDRAAYEEMERRRGGPAAEEGPVLWAHSGVPGSEVRWRTSPQTPPQSSNGPQSPGISSDPSRETAPAPTAGPSSPSPPDPTAPPSPSTLKELLTPLWHNPMWAEMMAAREDACEPAAPPSAGHTVGEKDTVPLVDVLSTSDAQELLHMLANVVDADPGPTEGASPSRLISDSLAGDSSTVLLELRLPATSAHRHVPGSPSTHEHRRTSSGETDAAPQEVAGDPPSSISDKTAGAEDASTMSAALASSPGPRLPPAGQGPAIRSAALQQETRLLRPFMQVVATLWPESDLVLGTAILTNMPMAVRSESEASGGSKTSLRETDIRASKAHPESDNVGSAGPSATPTVGEAPPCGEASQSGKATQSDERPEPQAVSSSPKNARGSGPENASSRRSPSAEAPLTTPPSTHLSAAAVALPPSPSTPLAPSTARQRSDRPALVREVAAEDVPRLSTLPSDLLELLTVEDLPVQDLEEEDEHRATVRRRGLPTLTVSGGTRQPAAPTRLQHHSMPSLLELDEDVNPISSLDVKESDADEQALDRLRQACRTGSTGSLAGSTGSLATTFQPPARQDGGEAEDGADEAECGSPLHGAALSSALTVATEKAPASIASSETTYASRNTMRREQDLVSSPSEERPITNVVPSRIDPSESCSADTFRTFLSSSESGRIILTLDWSSTSLGDISEWSPELRSHVMAILACPFQLALWIGPDGVLLYNDAYARLIGSKHPASMGKSGAEAWAAAAWSDTVEFASMNALGQTTLQHDQCVMLTRDGMLEECYVTWAYASLRDGQGRMIGYQHPSFETTARVIAERRLSTLREISQQTLMVQNIEELAKKALCALATNAYDLPFALLYTCDTVSATPGKRTLGKGATNTSTHSSSGGGLPTSGLSGKGAPSSRRIRLKLQGTIGVPEGHSSAPSKITCALFQGADFDASSGTWSMSSPATNENTASSTTSDATSTSTVWPIVEALHTRKPVFMSDLGKRVEGFASRGWPDPLERGVVVPILEEGTELPGAILIVGLNPRRPFNSPYSVFLSLIARTISTALLSVATYQEQVRKARDLAAMYDARGSFFASVSHELRTPLTLILGPLEDVLVSAKSKLTKNDRVRLETVQRASHRLHNMVNNLLDVSQLESGRLNCKFRPMQIGPRVRELAELFRPAIERCGITFDVQHEEDKWSVGSPFYMADEFLERMLFNLLGNALKYTLSGTIKVTVSFDASSACISIADTGIGIREDDLEAIFERFHRVQSTSRSFEGSGIGLALVLGLVETCGGTITVASTVDEGSTFTIRLPRGSQHLSPDALEAEPFESLSPVPRTAQSLAVIGDAEAWRYEPARSTPTTPSDGSGSFLDLWTPPSSPGCDVDRFQPSMFDLRKESTVCLVVDDNPQMRAWISSELAKSWTVVEAANGKDALDYALGHPVSIIVTDLAMPVMNGRELLDAIRDHPSTQTIPFIFLSAQAGTDARVEALLLGADDFMTKPFQSSELVARVKVHLQLGEVRKELERRVEERTAALAESERKYREISDQYQTLSLMSPVGIFQTDSSGQILFANPRFSEITGCSRAGPYAGWQDSVVSEDASKVHQMWDDAVQGWKADRAVVTSEFRFANGKWVQLELRAYERGYIGSLTDISHQKEVEAFHLDEVEKRAKDAEETRRGTEAFMDMASHELRNPLSGMWQNAEVVLTSLKTFLAWLDRLQADQVCDTALLHEMRRELAENIDGVESIRICAEHQKRIADDIINVSKLNLGLLSIELAPCNLEGVLHDVLKSFDPVARNQHVELSFSRDASLDRLGVEVVVADAGRVRQLAWNFISNALKYAAKSSSKTVSIRLAATDTAPSQSPSSRRIAAPEQSFDPPPGYIWCLVSIEDSGPGLSPEQLARLFARFSQANPSTDQYGGSGLGLYISKKLIELHRGFIEVESALGVGSRFTFAFPAKRVKAEERALDIQVDVAASSSRDQGSAASESPPSDVMTAEGGMPSYFEPAKRARSVQQDSSSAATGPIRVLIVEDNVINQKVMSRQLKQQGFEVTIAGDGQQALDALSADVQKIVDAQAQAASSSFAASAVPFPGFHIVLMDIEMPVMDGLTAIRELRRREREGEIPRHYPVCAVTGNAREAQRKECLEAGFDDIANKPYDLARLLQQISRLIGLPLSSPR